VLALVYQAYAAKHGVWPDNQTAKAILMASATDMNHDVFKQGAGAVNADVATAAGLACMVPTWPPARRAGRPAIIMASTPPVLPTLFPR